MKRIRAVVKTVWVNRKAEIALVTALVPLIRMIVQAASGH